MTDHEWFRTALGAYVLGHLPSDEMAQVEEHLTTCPTCRAERDELQPVVALLAGARGVVPPSRDEVPASEIERPPADLGIRVAQTIERERRAEARRRGWRATGLTVVGSAAAAAVLVAGISITRPDAAPIVPRERVAVAVQQPGVTAGAELVAHTWGVEVKLEGSGFHDGERYTVSVLARDGRPHPAGEFVGTGAAPMLCNLSSSVLRDAAEGFEVRDARGDLVVSSRFA